MPMFKSTKNALLSIVIAPWLAIPAMTIIDMLFILARSGNYTTADMGVSELFFTNLLLNSIVFAPVSYLLTILIFLPFLYLLNLKSSINIFRAVFIGMGIGFITPSLIKSVFYLYHDSSVL